MVEVKPASNLSIDSLRVRQIHHRPKDGRAGTKIHVRNARCMEECYFKIFNFFEMSLILSVVF